MVRPIEPVVRRTLRRAPTRPTEGDSMAERDLRQLPRNDLGVLAAGALAFIFSFFPYYGASAKAGGFSYSVSVNAWHGTALLGMLLVVAAAIVAAIIAFSPD